MTLPDINYQSPLENLSNSRFGGRTTQRETVIQIGLVRTVLIPNNPNRFHWIAINEGANDVRITNDPTVSVTSGWLLPANGGVISMNWEEDGESVGYEIFGIANLVPANVRVREVYKV